MITKECKVCKENKQWIKSEPYMNQYKYRDEKGAAWHRRMCPECYRVWARDYRKAKYAAFRAENPIQPKARPTPQAYGYVGKRTKLRNCGQCGTSTWNYFNCSPCLTKMEASGHAGIAEAAFNEMWGVT